MVDEKWFYETGVAVSGNLKIQMMWINRSLATLAPVNSTDSRKDVLSRVNTARLISWSIIARVKVISWPVQAFFFLRKYSVGLFSAFLFREKSGKKTKIVTPSVRPLRSSWRISNLGSYWSSPSALTDKSTLLLSTRPRRLIPLNCVVISLFGRLLINLFCGNVTILMVQLLCYFSVLVLLLLLADFFFALRNACSSIPAFCWKWFAFFRHDSFS